MMTYCFNLVEANLQGGGGGGAGNSGALCVYKIDYIHTYMMYRAYLMAASCYMYIRYT